MRRLVCERHRGRGADGKRSARASEVAVSCHPDGNRDLSGDCLTPRDPDIRRDDGLSIVADVLNVVAAILQFVAAPPVRRGRQEIPIFHRDDEQEERDDGQEERDGEQEEGFSRVLTFRRITSADVCPSFSCISPSQRPPAVLADVATCFLVILNIASITHSQFASLRIRESKWGDDHENSQIATEAFAYTSFGRAIDRCRRRNGGFLAGDDSRAAGRGTREYDGIVA